MKMMKLSRLAAVALSTALLLSACTGEKTEPYPSPVARSNTPTASPTAEEGTPKPAPAPKPAVTIDNFLFTTEQEIKGLSKEDLADILETSEKFALQGFSPKFLNGEWMDQDIEEITSDFSDYSTPTVLAALESIDLKDPESANSLASVAALFSPTNSVQVTSLCSDETAATEDCLRSDLVFSAPDISKDEKRIVVKFEVSTVRDLMMNEISAQSEVTIKHTLIFEEHKDEWLVGGITNTFTYGKVEEV